MQKRWLSVMKNILYYLVVLLLIIGIFSFSCSACSSVEKQQESSQQKVSRQLNQPFQSKGKISYKGVEAEITMDRSADGCYQIAFLEPSPLKGCTISTEGNRVSITYQNMTLEMTSDEFFNSSAVKMVISSINRVTSGYGFHVSMEDHQLSVSGLGETGEFSLLLDPDNSNILSIKIPSEDFEMQFENFKFLN